MCMNKLLMVLSLTVMSVSFSVAGEKTANRKPAQVYVNGKSPKEAYAEFLNNPAVIKVETSKGSNGDIYSIKSNVNLTPRTQLMDKKNATLHGLNLVLLSDHTFMLHLQKNARVEFVKYEGMLNDAVVSNPEFANEELIKGKWQYSGTDITLSGVGQLNHLIVNGKAELLFRRGQTASAILNELPAHLALVK